MQSVLNDGSIRGQTINHLRITNEDDYDKSLIYRTEKLKKTNTLPHKVFLISDLFLCNHTDLKDGLVCWSVCCSRFK